METYLLFVAKDHAVPCSDAYIHCSLKYVAAFDNNSEAWLQNNTADQQTL